jgi:hypothetical protein
MNPLNFFLESDFIAFQFGLGKIFLALFLGQYCKLPFLGEFGGAIFYISQ